MWIIAGGATYWENIEMTILKYNRKGQKKNPNSGEKKRITVWMYLLYAEELPKGKTRNLKLLTQVRRSLIRTCSLNGQCYPFVPMK